MGERHKMTAAFHWLICYYLDMSTGRAGIKQVGCPELPLLL